MIFGINYLCILSILLCIKAIKKRIRYLNTKTYKLTWNKKLELQLLMIFLPL